MSFLRYYYNLLMKFLPTAYELLIKFLQTSYEILTNYFKLLTDILRLLNILKGKNGESGWLVKINYYKLVTIFVQTS